MPRVHTLFKAMAIVGRAARKGKPRSYIWVSTARGSVKVHKPVLTMTGIDGDVEVYVQPRFQCRVAQR